HRSLSLCSFVLFFTAPPPTELYTLSLHDALPICEFDSWPRSGRGDRYSQVPAPSWCSDAREGAEERSCQRRRPWCSEPGRPACRSEEHTSELQSRENLVCRLLLEKKKKKRKSTK